MKASYLVCFLAFAACDSKATASDPWSGGRAELKSREYESCSASLHCQDNLRCFAGECRRTVRSTVGDYYAAAGAAAREAGDLEAAITAYARALGHYDNEKVSLPPDIDCAYGATLAAARSQKEHAELAARVLHRCILAVPAGGRLREEALGQLVLLTEAGLDPLLLGANKIADLYLTREPQGVDTDKLAITLVATPQPSRSFGPIQSALTGPELRPALIACWQAYNAATKKEALSVTIGVKSVFVEPEYDDDPIRYAQRFEDLRAGADPVEACVRQVVEPAIKGLKLSERFNTKLALTIK